MQIILSLNCIYDTARQSWAIELALEGGATHRFPISPDQVETIVEAFDDCSKAEFNPATEEVVFAFEYEEYEDEDEEDKEGEEGEDEEAEGDEGEEEEEEKPSVRQKRQDRKGESSKSSSSTGKRRSR